MHHSSRAPNSSIGQQGFSHRFLDDTRSGCKMTHILSLILISLVVQLSVAPPVTQNKKESKSNEVEDNEEMAGIMEYRRYLQEVVQALDSDPVFREKLQKADENELRTGKIADQLEFVNHKVRTKLDELKREELERLRHLTRKEHNLVNGINLDHLKIAEHLDHSNTRTFEIQDLKNLIAKITKDLAEADKKRREGFKEYEMQKKFEEEQKLKSMNEAERKKYEEELQALKEKHKKHEPVHHPGSKQQLEEVWEQQDHMEEEDFNPRTFFFLHDIDGNGVWDQDEVKALFLKELDKLYAQGATGEDVLKRTEEMERMREHVFNESDLNKDGFISYEEFLEQTKKPAFQQDEGWEGLDDQQIYTHEEFEEFEKRKQEEIQRMVAQGLIPPHESNMPVHSDSFPPHHANAPGQGGAPPQHYPNQNVPVHQPVQYQEQHPGQYVQHQPVAHQQQYPNHIPVQNTQDQVAQQQQYRPQVPQAQVHQPVQGHVQNQQYHQVPQQQHPQQEQPPQYQQQPQVPPYQQPQQPASQGAAPNVASQQNNPSQPHQSPMQQGSQSAQAQPVQPGAAQRNSINSAGKV